MNAKTHWEKIYTTKAADRVSWYRPHLDTSIALIERARNDRSASIIDVGGGESTLVDDLLARGFQAVTVLDVSQAAIEVTKKRLARLADRVRWLTADTVRFSWARPLMTCGTTAPFFISSPRPRSAPPTFGKPRVPLRPAAILSSARSDPKARPNAAGSMSSATMPNPYTTSSALASGWWKVRRNCTRRRSAPHNNFYIATAELKRSEFG